MANLDHTRLDLLKRAALLLADIEGVGSLNGEHAGAVDLRQRTAWLRATLVQHIAEADPAYYGYKPR